MRAKFINFAIFLLHGLHLTLIGMIITSEAFFVFAPSDQLFTSGIIFLLIGIMTIIGAAFLLHKLRPILTVAFAFVLIVTLFYLFNSLDKITEMVSTAAVELENEKPVPVVEIEGFQYLRNGDQEADALQGTIKFLSAWKSLIVLSGSLLLIPLFSARPRKIR